jgi:hypothetical protein
LRSIIQEANIDKSLDKLRESSIPQGSTKNGVGFGDVITLLVGRRVTVRVTDKGESRIDGDGLGRVHEIVARVFDNLPILVELGVVLEGEKDSAGGP